jgi:hypothetical protein
VRAQQAMVRGTEARSGAPLRGGGVHVAELAKDRNHVEDHIRLEVDRLLQA